MADMSIPNPAAGASLIPDTQYTVTPTIRARAQLWPVQTRSANRLVSQYVLTRQLLSPGPMPNAQGSRHQQLRSGLEEVSEQIVALAETFPLREYHGPCHIQRPMRCQ